MRQQVHQNRRSKTLPESRLPKSNKLTVELPDAHRPKTFPIEDITHVSDSEEEITIYNHLPQLQQHQQTQTSDCHNYNQQESISQLSNGNFHCVDFATAENDLISTQLQQQTQEIYDSHPKIPEDIIIIDDESTKDESLEIVMDQPIKSRSSTYSSANQLIQDSSLKTESLDKTDILKNVIIPDLKQFKESEIIDCSSPLFKEENVKQVTLKEEKVRPVQNMKHEFDELIQRKIQKISAVDQKISLKRKISYDYDEQYGNVKTEPELIGDLPILNFKSDPQETYKGSLDINQYEKSFSSIEENLITSLESNKDLPTPTTIEISSKIRVEQESPTKDKELKNNQNKFIIKLNYQSDTISSNDSEFYNSKNPSIASQSTTISNNDDIEFEKNQKQKLVKEAGTATPTNQSSIKTNQNKPSASTNDKITKEKETNAQPNQIKSNQNESSSIINSNNKENKNLQKNSLKRIRVKSKPLSEIVNNTSNNFKKSRIGLSKKSKIDHLHDNIKR
ncbi:uncharacterized protein KGF55_003548 [Candida pseudojiufengensis]|uniref:uncharacterized protein n=1 Tax=Candida pseudojiufengensis TaxID=497109 RepID=UPI002224072B|nr:uncharacterized protein KGF55_003548 [Candida pseudojiufengensis]KAI5962472.1 hypothetical protein KGF55_003548 [Candida pseudojiufengensis]